MTCLVHDKHYRSLFHGVINELRKSRSISVNLLIQAPKTCCTCNDNQDDETIEPIIAIRAPITFERLENFVQLVQTKNVKLTRSLNRLISIINHSTAKKLSTSSQMDMDESNSSSNTGSVNEKQAKTKLRLRRSVFFFLSYRSQRIRSSTNADHLIEIAHDLVRTRFLQSIRDLSCCPKSTGRISLIDSNSDSRLKNALDETIEGLRAITIHNREEAMASYEKNQGEWVLFRPNLKTKHKIDVDNIAEELTVRWERALQSKRAAGSCSSSKNLYQSKRFRR